MCSDDVMFSTSSNSYPHGKLTCYDDNGSELERKKEGEEFTPGTTCVFLSTGHVSTGGFVIEMFCQEARWQIVLTELWSLSLPQFRTQRLIMSLPPNKKFHIYPGCPHFQRSKDYLWGLIIVQRWYWNCSNIKAKKKVLFFKGRLTL